MEPVGEETAGGRTASRHRSGQAAGGPWCGLRPPQPVSPQHLPCHPPRLFGGTPPPRPRDFISFPDAVRNVAGVPRCGHC